MRISVSKYLVLLFLISPVLGFSQDDVLIEDNQSEKQQTFRVDEKGSEEDTPKVKKEKKKKDKDQDKKEKIKKRDKTPSLIAEHKKDKIQRYFKVGETIKYQTKTDKKVIKGTLEEIKADKVIIDGKEVKVAELILLGKTFGRTMGWRSAGFSKFAVGTGVATAGTLLLIFSANQYSVDNSNVVWGVLGSVAGAGVSFVGIHLMVKGGKGMFQSSNKKQKRGWTFKVKM